MISLQRSKQMLSEETLSKKRKLDDPENQEIPHEKPKDGEIRSTKPVFDFNIHSQAQFASEWQQCLDIKSGQVYLFNTRTNKRILGDSSSGIEECNPSAPMSLELELNLPNQSPRVVNQREENWRGHDYRATSNSQFIMASKAVKDSDMGLARAPSWLTFEGEQPEMITAVCRKCYMLVMMCKSSPSCPNCKFVHPSEAVVKSSTKG